MSQKNILTLTIFACLVVAIVVVGGYTFWSKRVRETPQQSAVVPVTETELPKSRPADVFKTERVDNSAVLLSLAPDGRKMETGLKVPYTWDTSIWPIAINFLVSSDRSRVAYYTFTPEPDRPFLLSFFVAGLDGKDVRKVATQTWPEGSGQVVEDSLRWIDSNQVTYETRVNICGEGQECEFNTETKTYTIDVTKGTTTLSDTNQSKE